MCLGAPPFPPLLLRVLGLNSLLISSPLFFSLLALFINVLLWAVCSRHMSTFDKALVCVYNIPCLGLWNEGANKLAFYVYLCVGVSEWWLRGEVGEGTEWLWRRNRRQGRCRSHDSSWLLLLSIVQKHAPPCRQPPTPSTRDWINTILCITIWILRQ